VFKQREDDKKILHYGKNLLLAFIPDTDALNKKWWHRLAKVFAVVWSVLVGLAIICVFFYLVLNIYLFQRKPTLYKIADEKWGVSQTVTIEELGRCAKYLYPSLQALSNYEAGKKTQELGEDDPEIIKFISREYYWGMVSPEKEKQDLRDKMVYFLIPAFFSLIVTYFVPTIAYRTILYVAVGKFKN